MISFSERLKTLRKQNDYTQEQLAEYMGVSPQAVSHWECGTTCPDISLLPPLAYLLHVTTDTLLGVDMQKANDRIREIIESAQSSANSGNFKSAVQILQDGLRQFPNAYPIMASLAHALSCIDLNSYAEVMDEPEGSAEKISEEVFTLCQRILSECTDHELREQALQTFIYRYKNIGQKEKAIEYANMLSHIWTSREAMLLTMDPDIPTLRHCISFCTDRLMQCLAILSTKDCFSYEEKETLLLQIITISNTIFCDGDSHYYAHHLISAYETLAEIYSMRKDKGNALSALEGMCDASILFDTYADDALKTSPAVRGDCDGRPIPWNENSCARLTRCLNEEPWYAFLREEPRFAEVMRKLKENAVPSKK